MKAYSQKILPVTLVSGLILACLALVLYITNTRFDIFWLVLKITGIIYFFYLTIEWLFIQKEQQLTEEVERLQHEKQVVQKTLDTKRQALEEYFMLWVHQIKTPISALALLSEEHPIDSKALRSELIKIENYVNLAMHYVKVTNPDRDMNLGSVSLDHIIRPLLKRYRYQFIKQNITLHYEAIEDQVVTDSNLAQVMIEQVLNNSLKYTKNGNIWISYDKKEKNLRVADDGLGIMASDLPQIFKRGYSGFNGQLNQKSSGIGLYLVDMISKRLNHFVHITSIFGEGTTFTIQFKNKISN